MTKTKTYGEAFWISDRAWAAAQRECEKYNAKFAKTEKAKQS